MRYTLLLYYPEADADTVGADTIAAFQRELAGYAAELHGAGVLVGAEVFQPSWNTTTVRLVRAKGEFEAIDEPLGSVGTPLGGIVTLEVADRAAALVWAREAPTIRSGVVEVRPSLTHTVDGAWTVPEDYETVRALADAGDPEATDWLADIADRHGDLEGLYELLEEGCGRAGEHLVRRAVAAGDIAELRRISAAGYDPARRELERLEGGMQP